MPEPLEAAVRNELCRWLPQQKGVQAIREFWVPRSNERADLALLGPSLVAFEIKTARDSLRRLPRQAAAYGRIFDRCTAVLAAKHVESAKEILPDWWGLIVIGDQASRPTLGQLRQAGQNPELDRDTLVRLLWKDETRCALESVGAPTTSATTRQKLWGELLAHMNTDQLRDAVRRALLGRDASIARMPSKRFDVKRLAADH